jgi:hypothetical protein
VYSDSYQGVQNFKSDARFFAVIQAPFYIW